MDLPIIGIYVRHSKNCPFKGDETWKRCNCWKHLRWRQNGEQERLPTKSRTWAGAEREKRKLELSFENATNGKPESSRQPASVQDAIKMFLTKKANKASATLAKYHQTLDKFQAFCNQLGRFFIADVTETDVQQFDRTWDSHADFTRRNHQERLRAFFRYCVASNEIRLSYNPTNQLEHVDVSDREPTPPYTVKEYQQILATISKCGLSDRQQTRIAGMIHVMRHAGLAIQDAAILQRENIQKTQVKKRDMYRIVIRRSKTGTPINNPVPKQFGEELLKILNGNPRYVFWTGNGKPTSTVKYWHKLFKKLFDASGVKDAIPHRFRDTFAVDLLEHGVPIRDVSRALGHKSVAITERHYAKWTQEQQNKMDDYIIGTWKKQASA